MVWNIFALWILSGYMISLWSVEKTLRDEFYVFKPTLLEGKVSILKRQLGSKALTMTYDERHHTMNIATPKEAQERFSITDAEVATLARYALSIEEHYTSIAGVYRPMDIEWAKDGVSGELFIVQARPETVQSRKLANNTLEQCMSVTMP